MKKLLVLAALSIGLLATAGSASAATVGQVGWWTRSPAASAPEGGFTVGNAPDGPISVAAVQVDVGDGVSSATLTIAQAGGAAPTAAQLVVCAVSAGFEAASGGPVEEAPATTCDGTSAALTSPDGITWRANVADLVTDRSGSVGFAIVPATGSTGIWDLQFEKPTLQATAKPSSGGSSSPSPSPFASPSPSSSFTPSRPPSTFAVPKPPSVAAPATTTTAAPTTTVVTAVPNVAAPTFSGRAGGGESDGRPIGQAITMVVLAAIVGVGAGVVHKVAAARLSV